MTRLTLLIPALSLLAACSSDISSATHQDSQASRYSFYQQMTPVRDQRVVESMDTHRYSEMHIMQSSYLFN